MKVLLIGCNGQLGSDLYRSLETGGISVVGVTHAQLDVADAEQVDEVVRSVKPAVVISTAAFHKVEECEKNPARSFQVNATGPWNLARACQHHDAILVHFSTDYVFDGRKSTPYLETDLPAPVNVYGISKLAGEHLIATVLERFFIIRTCGLYGLAGSSGKGGNFVETMLRKAADGTTVRVVMDQVLTPTATADLARIVLQLIATDSFGLYHVSSEGQCSWYEFTHKIYQIQGLEVDLRPVTTSEFPNPVKRPSYSVLGKSRLRSLGLVMPPWEESLARYLQARVDQAPLLAPRVG